MQQLNRKYLLTLSLAFCFVTGCSKDLAKKMGIVLASDLAGRYTGVLQAVSVPNLTALEDENQRVIIDIDLLHEVTATEISESTLRFESDIIRPFRTLVVGVQAVAMNLDFIGFEGFDLSKPGQTKLDGFNVKQLIFVKNEKDDWIYVVQFVRIGLESQGDGRAHPNEINVYQYVSYDPETTQAMNQSDAIVYVNSIFRLASKAQRLN